MADCYVYEMLPNRTIVPTIGGWFEAIPTVYIVFIGICCALVACIFLMTIRMAWLVHYCIPDEYHQGDLYFIIWMPLFVSFTCLLGNIIPRSGGVLYAIGLVYLMMCLHISIVLIIRLFGTRKEMTDWLNTNNKLFAFDVRPWCCCCHCLPSMKPTARRVRYLTYLVKQSPIVRIFLQLVLVIMSLEGVYESTTAVQIINGIGVASTILAVYISHVIVEAVTDHLIPYNMNVFFRCVDIAQVLFTFQKFILDLIAKNGGMGGLSVASPAMVSRWFFATHIAHHVKVRFWHNVAMTFELTLICYMLFKNMVPEKSKFFGEPKPQRCANGNAVPLTDL